MYGLILLSLSLMLFGGFELFWYISIWGLAIGYLFCVLDILSLQLSFSLYNGFISVDTISILLYFYLCGFL